jgi:predicted O-methyltransferase YrrM
MTMRNGNPNEKLFFFDALPLDWQMTRCEKVVLASLVDQADADVAIEVGTFKGGSLQVVSAKTEKVYSLDINEETQESLRPQFADVEFLAGDSRLVLPRLLDKLQSESAPLGFVLI